MLRSGDICSPKRAEKESSHRYAKPAIKVSMSMALAEISAITGAPGNPFNKKRLA